MLALTNGLNWVIPINFDPNAKLIKEFEQLMPDFWRFELELHKIYKPVDIKNHQKKTFDLGYFMERVLASKPDYAIYLGSETTPPCKGKFFFELY
jgi:hypothetical protein